ncbi:glycoside hydrolase family 88 protein [Flavobacterium sp. GT3R68]|uniref:glycoside hydrolase family 88 protein n=1 Tax=Flavobacterium sp. GT3R68 TaxID=2594437 RepID=UPI000F8784F8|nr:glycoside hydrolase family 88 protein [Flavobacterium sp. GT3R68]RTY92300.1 hypothetical protein EKL32_18005 [Flavobacterium sp. GSN2]TRW92536.1 hypothetical protein FNW07_05930 [Flavobacterium sp. GT3R68]
MSYNLLLNVAFITFVVLVLITLLIDYVPLFNTWQGRIHIGRFDTASIWKQKVLQKSRFWLKHTPTIKLTDNDRLIIIDILKGNYKRNAIQHWQEAALVLGLTEHYYKTNDAATKEQIDRYVNSKIDASGSWKNIPKEIDGVILSYAFLNIDWLDHDKYKPAYDAIWDLLKELVGEDRTVLYRVHAKDYRFVDTIGFICPFLISYGKKFNIEESVNLGIHQIKEFNKYGMFKDTFIPCHTYHVKTKFPVGLFGWGRGLGWYAIGLIDVWKELPNDHIEKNGLTESVILFAKMAMQFQNENGSWNWMVSNKESRPDSSTTATLAWFLANASQIDEIKQECLSSKEKALDYLMKVTRRDGAIDFSQGDTKAIGVYSQHFDILPFTQGFTLRTINMI